MGQKVSVIVLMVAMTCTGGLGSECVDYALSRHCDAWTHHPVFGDASFDAFDRLPGNPVCRGTDEYRWPVNGSLFRDPASSDWFLYVGWYQDGYKIGNELRSHCMVYRSKDQGRTWQEMGEPFAGIGTHLFAGEISPLWDAPDVAVCYRGGRYHMSFDWCTKGTTWENILSKNDPKVNSGAGYAVADAPEGPFKPVVAISNNRDASVLYGKFNRYYGSTLLPRGNDWIALTLVDSHQYFGWGLVGQTAPKPDGPWTSPKLVLHPQLDRYFPPLLEYFPAFLHEGYIYSPATSVAGNRNYQVIFRAPIEQAMDSETWELYQAGSLWHAEPIESEYEGIWGQTFAGFIDNDGIFNVMFPSRDADNQGTIHLARRPWNKPLRERGFVVSGHVAPGMTLLRHDTALKRLVVSLKIHGTVLILWNHQGPFGADKPKADCGLHPLMRSRFNALQITKDTWALIRYGNNGNKSTIADGKMTESTQYKIDIRINDGLLQLMLNDKNCWEGPFESGKGRIGVWTEPRSHVAVESFVVDGTVEETAMAFLHTEAILGAAQSMEDWQKVESPAFRYGEGVVSKSAGVEVKWNFIGTGFALWAPTGPDYGRGELWLNGDRLAEIHFNTKQPSNSCVIYEKHDLPVGCYGLKLKRLEGCIPVDVLEAFSGIPADGG